MFEYYEAADGWRWRLLGLNGEIVAHGEAYTSEAHVLRGIRTVQDIILLGEGEVDVRKVDK